MNRRGFLGRLVRSFVAAPVLAFARPEPFRLKLVPEDANPVYGIEWGELIETTIAGFVRGRREELIESFARHAAVKNLLAQRSVRFGDKEAGGKPLCFVVREQGVGGDRSL